LIQLCRLVEGQGRRFLATNQFSDSRFGFVRGTEVDDALGRGASSEEVHEFFIGENHNSVTL
jgi:hypothetical protein